MPHYRIYRIGDDGHILGLPRIIDCEGDEAAMRQARSLLLFQRLELWQGDRLVVSLNPERMTVRR